MNNFEYTRKLKKSKNLILNHFAEKSENFYFNFLNKNKMIGRMNVGTREQWSGCHIRVQYFSTDAKAFKEFEKPKAYYITFNAYNDYRKNPEGLGVLSVSLRADLVEYWAGVDVSNCYVLFLSSLNGMIYEMPAKNIVDYALKNKASCGICYNGCRDYIIPVENDTVEYESKYNSERLLPMKFDEKSYKPEYISNFTYSVYRKGTSIKVGMFSASGKFMNERIFRSISELYDKIKTVYDKSKKTLQRQVAKEEAIKLSNGMMIIISSDLDKKFTDADYAFNEVVDTWTKNALFDEEQPEDSSNPRLLPVKSHYEPVKKCRDNWEEHYQDVEEDAYYDDEVEQTVEDCLEIIKLMDKEKQDIYIKEVKELHNKLRMYSEDEAEYKNLILELIKLEKTMKKIH